MTCEIVSIGDELLVGVSRVLRLRVGEGASPYRLWCCLGEHFEGAKLSQIQTVIFFDDMDRADPSCFPVLERLLHLTHRHAGCATTIFSARSVSQSALNEVLIDSEDLRIELSPLNADETSDYVTRLLQQAGRDGEVFTADALALLYERTNGLPRDVNRLCDLSLLAGMVQGCHRIEPGIVDSVSRELHVKTTSTDVARLANG